MASRHPPKSYDEQILNNLEQALREVWQVLRAHSPYKDWDKDIDLKKSLAYHLMDLADSGITDAHELRNRALESFDLGWQH